MADSKFCKGCQRGDEDVNAEAWCSDCSELVCKVCARVHERMSPPHKVVQMKEIPKLSTSLLNLSKNCENHPDQKIVLYCCQHDKIICGSCVPESHQNCKPLFSVEKAAKGVKDGTAFFDLDKRLDNLSQITENILSHSEATLDELTKDRNSIKKRVSEIKQKFIAHLQKLEADIHKDIDNKYKHCNATVVQIKDIIRSSADSLSIWKNDLKSLKQHLSEIHLFQIVKFLDAKTHQKELEIREIQKATVPTLTYIPSNLNKLLPDLGTIMVDNLTVATPVLNIDQQGQFLIRDHQMLSLTHSFKTTQLGDEVKIYRGCFIPDNRLLLNPFQDRKLFVCNLDGSNPKKINLKYPPECITLYDNNYAVVSLGEEGIQFIDLKSLKPGKKINVKPKCVGITSLNGTIWVHNQANTLTNVNIYGKILNTIQTKFNPWEIFANKEGGVYCIDSCSDKVYMVTPGGIEREIIGSYDLTNPYGVAIDNHGNVYVAGKDSNNIHKISNGGLKHDIVLTADDGIIEPTGLSYNCETEELLIINEKWKSIKIYKTQ